ncbi:spermine synthase [Paenibacillus sp. JMULE4]|uniref:spermine synthase n=1 Tax=Paenibacillus sp. JMULE4 TaxID=2518342 RepID=UPI001575B965|nr:spermine synthase [Paenibacillus sp. JMULE4]NTZ19078.1 spermine synthase [Paenibacillus sp. JMULE4]
MIFNLVQPFTNFLPFRAYQTSPANLFLGEKDTHIVYSDWNSFSRTDVYDAGDGQLLYITIDGGAVSPISKYTGDLQQVDYLRWTTSFLAFQDVTKERVLIIGAGGGQEVLTAKMAGFEQIEAVDINPGSFRAVEAMSSFSGNVFKQPGVREIVSDGRNYIRQTQNQYDLIYLSLVKKESENALGMTLTENYMFTVEAVGEYLKKLKPGGRLAFLLHNEMELAKVMTAVEKSLKSEGVTNNRISDHIAVIGTFQHLGHEVWGMGGSVITRPLLIINKRPISLMLANRLKSETESIQQIPIHIPHVNDQYSSLSKLLADQKVNLAANSDDMPFFYNKTGKIPYSFIWIVVLTFLFVFVFARITKNGYGGTAYFSGIAIGFIIIETTLVQRLILPLGHPTLSFVLVLGILLIAGGIGSLLSGIWFNGQTKRFVPLLIITILAIGVNSGITWYNEQMFYLPLIYRIAVAAILLFPLGFFMGMPFPYGLTQVSERQTAVSWAINGLMTVAGSLLSVMISMTMGFTVAMMIGAAVYGLLYIVHPKLVYK